jgi:hypothetical protein
MTVIWRIFVVILIIQAGDSKNVAQAMTIDEAVNVLKETKPFRMPYLIAYRTDPEKKKVAEDLFEKQVIAISVVGRSKNSKTTELLIPFLDYSAPGFNPYLVEASSISSGGRKAVEDKHLTILHWPVLAALLAIPDSSQVLMIYALDPRNPMDFRVGAFQALRYYPDAGKFKTVAKALHAELDHLGLPVQEALKRIENGTDYFQGASLNDNLPE